MPSSGIPCLNLAVTPLQAAGTDHFAIHVTQAPYPGGLVLRDCIWTDSLSQLWQEWQEMFSNKRMPPYPYQPLVALDMISEAGQSGGLSGRLMQTLGVQLWQWLFAGSVLASLNHSQGIALGQSKPLRLRLEIRDASLIALPWEIMQEAPARQAISLSQQVLFSRTTSDVNPLPPLRSDYGLRVLLVLGQETDPISGSGLTNNSLKSLKLEQEAAILAQVLKSSGNPEESPLWGTACQVDTLVQPAPDELIQALEKRVYNVLFYAGHGMPGSSGGLIFLRPDLAMNGTELAQVLTRCQVKLAVFNACWGAQPDYYEDEQGRECVPGVKLAQPIPRSSLAEVLIHHGVPAVLAMRDPIADQEALSFIQVFAQALVQRLPIDQAVAVARQNLLTLYKFNHQTWTLPVLYMHPEFNGELLKPLETSKTGIRSPEPLTHLAYLRSLVDGRVWQIRGGLMKIGRNPDINDLVLKEDESGVSRAHARIFCREGGNETDEVSYFLEDFSRFGTWILSSSGWQKLHHHQVALKPKTQIKFGSPQNEAMEFIITNPGEIPTSE